MNSDQSFLMTRRNFVASSLAAAGGAVTMGIPISSWAAGKAPVATTVNGPVLGYATANVNVFKGIPYGAPTGGSARFKRSTHPNPWSEPRVTHAVGDPCYQINEDWKGWVDNRNGSEDCLVLNVWSPIGAERKPVMVFLHGGAYRFGSGGAPLYDGENLSERGDVVVVTVNHRLHALGFTYFADLAPQAGFATNVGLLDLVDALEWVKANIAQFGGDPGNVTIFGESGGGGKVSCLMAMPSAKGLFHRVIVQSGAQRRLRTREEATKDTIALLKELNLGEKDAVKLTDVPVEQLFAAFKKVLEDDSSAPELSTAFSPVMDGEILPWNPTDDEALKLSSSVPKMYGTNAHETAYYLDFAGLLTVPKSDDDVVRDTAAFFKTKFKPEHSADIAKLLADYKARSPNEPLDRIKGRMISDLWMASDALKAATRASLDASAAPVYHYMFTWEEPYKGDFWSIHGAELLFVFGRVDADEMWGEAGAPTARADRDPEGMRYILRDDIISAWTSFAKDGKPHLKDKTEWTAFDAEGLRTMVFGKISALESDIFGPTTRELFSSIEVGVGA
ncbi:carboxylesterase/lipase family protein [Rhizobium etli]|uniref:carboxylesterase/lipase family protein n=1 Tax=Rhizobium etli TaxID=29449 RepID=UPI000423505A|nr:carboxylesterase family protein [Rhizobium etli]